MTKNCKKCGSEFLIEPDDLEFYKKMDIPPPTLCPHHREQRRLARRNEIYLYARKCDLTGKEILAAYSKDKPFKVYAQPVWWSDKWNALDYGRDFDFSRPFFEQFEELQKEVPRYNVYNQGSENCEYTNYAPYNKNCYLVFGGWRSEDCMYCHTLIKDCKNCIDCYNIRTCELAYENVDTEKIYNCHFCISCHGCTDSIFLYDCRSCTNCAFSVNLRNKKNYLFNKKSTKEEINAFRESLKSYKKLEEAKEKFKKMINDEAAHKYFHGSNNENIIGDYVYDSKNVFYVIDSWGNEDVKYSNRFAFQKDSQDINGTAEGELIYDSMCTDYSHNCRFGSSSDKITDSDYCDNCYNSKNLFGCIGLNHQEYCILNKKYPKKEYEDLRAKIIEHMKETGEWGEHFPIEISPFCYNETVANDYYPLEKDEAVKDGYKWQDYEESTYNPSDYEIPDNIDDMPDEITKEILACEDCGRNYKIIKQELAFYRKNGIPVPRKCPKCRHFVRFHTRNGRDFFERKCAAKGCTETFQTTYTPDGPKNVYCEKHYLENLN